MVHFVNPDLIASGLSPLRPELAAVAGGGLFLRELDRLGISNEDFAFESTLSGLTYLNRLKRWKTAGRRRDCKAATSSYFIGSLDEVKRNPGMPRIPLRAIRATG
ncbi:MAG: hypothetical protein ACREP3_03115 [Candidatus Binatia bacterium]